MKNKLLLFLTLLIAFSASAQHSDWSNTLQMSVNTINANDSIRINNYIQKQRKSRSLLAVAGLSVLGGIVNDATSIFINEIMNVANIRSNQQAEWETIIENECYYLDSLSYTNGLKDFYSSGSFDGPLDPANFNFNGFTLESTRYGEDVLRFYCHVATDEAGLNCHLPNMAANDIYPDEEVDYGRNLSFSFDDRENLIVGLYFSITSSWYNEAVMLFRDVNLGGFTVQIPINEEKLEDGVFVYKRTDIDANREFYENNRDLFDPESPSYDTNLLMPDTTYLTISGDCFIVPRSYMPLPGGISHWGTGEYNVEFYITEQCNVTDEMRENWRRDYKKINRMKKESKLGSYMVSLYKQYGNTMVRNMIESASYSTIQQLGF